MQLQSSQKLQLSKTAAARNYNNNDTRRRRSPCQPDPETSTIKLRRVTPDSLVFIVCCHHPELKLPIHSE
jgi:hypothetical protein